MPKERSERKMYRRSPGRQYGYDYDPLRSQTPQNRQNDSGTSSLPERSPQREIPARASAPLVQRPNLRRTRQLTRKSIIESRRSALAEVDQQEQQPDEVASYDSSPLEEEDRTLYSSRRAARDAYKEHNPSTSQLSPEQDDLYEEQYADEDMDEYPHEQWTEVDPDAGFDDEYEEPDPLDGRVRYAQVPVAREERAPIGKRTRQLDDSYAEYDDGYEDDEDYDDYVEPLPTRKERRDKYEERDERPRRKSKKVSRRGLLFGLGAAAVTGTGIAAYELVPKIPSALDGAATNVEQQIQAAFEKGLAQGADNARRELIGALETIDGFTIDGAIGAAKLMRIAYDVFVSPIITQSANIAGDVLNAMLSAIKTARGILAQSFLDNSTLQAIQKVLQAWVDQVSTLPKQLNAITDTDLDGAQAYLNALKQKLEAEKAQLNKSATPTPTSTKSK
ncbi:MAG TPA: hypothetical protein DHW02_01510 [Ktedonobacter sp.]|nr:hypothetical protein [Ktedonobacter sp.]